MRQIFVDTRAWYALADSRDFNHEIACQFRNEVTGNYRLVITNYILDELYTLLLMNIGYNQTITFKQKLDVLTNAGIVDVFWVNEGLANHAWTIFEQFNTDKEWSFTDCVTYVVMKQERLTEAFTFDHHFVQMGYVKKPEVSKPGQK